jgi:hypothetical protein
MFYGGGGIYYYEFLGLNFSPKKETVLNTQKRKNTEEFKIEGSISMADICIN